MTHLPALSPGCSTCGDSGAGAAWLLIGLGALGIWWVAEKAWVSWKGATQMARCQHIGLVILMAGIAGMGLLTGCGDSSDGGVPVDGQQEVSNDNSKADPQDLVKKDGEAKEPGLPMFLDLGSKRCFSCKMMAPILDELKRDYADQFKTAYVDVRLPENAPVAKQYGVKMIPTLIFFDGHGKEIWRHEGFMSKEAILGKWAELGFEFNQTSPKAADEQPQGLEGDE
jgi:thiol-disulfide isomerase/thioredoxin